MPSGLLLRPFIQSSDRFHCALFLSAYWVYLLPLIFPSFVLYNSYILIITIWVSLSSLLLTYTTYVMRQIKEDKRNSKELVNKIKLIGLFNIIFLSLIFFSMIIILAHSHHNFYYNCLYFRHIF